MIGRPECLGHVFRAMVELIEYKDDVGFHMTLDADEAEELLDYILLLEGNQDDGRAL